MILNCQNNISISGACCGIDVSIYFYRYTGRHYDYFLECDMLLLKWFNNKGLR